MEVHEQTEITSINWYPKGRVWRKKRDDIFIIKLQRPVAGHPIYLIYNEDKSIIAHTRMDDPYTNLAVMKALGDNLKGYFYAQLKDTSLNLRGRASNQDW